MASVIEWLTPIRCVALIAILLQVIAWTSFPKAMYKLTEGVLKTLLVILSWFVEFLSYVVIGFVKLLEVK